MNSTGKKPSTSRSKTRTKRKLANSASKTKALVNKADHVRRQALKRRPQVQSSAETLSSNRKLKTNGKGDPRDVVRTGAKRNSSSALTGSMHALTFWSPMAVLLRQQKLLATMALNAVQAQRLLAQAWRHSATRRSLP
jgi:hypothetical protein